MLIPRIYIRLVVPYFGAQASPLRSLGLGPPLSHPHWSGSPADSLGPAPYLDCPLTEKPGPSPALRFPQCPSPLQEDPFPRVVSCRRLQGGTWDGADPVPRAGSGKAGRHWWCGQACKGAQCGESTSSLGAGAQDCSGYHEDWSPREQQAGTWAAPTGLPLASNFWSSWRQRGFSPLPNLPTLGEPHRQHFQPEITTPSHPELNA